MSLENRILASKYPRLFIFRMIGGDRPVRHNKLRRAGAAIIFKTVAAYFAVLLPINASNSFSENDAHAITRLHGVRAVSLTLTGSAPNIPIRIYFFVFLRIFVV